MQELDELDKQENNTGADELQIKKEKITQGLAKLKEPKKYTPAGITALAA